MLLAATPHFLIDVVGCHLVFFPYDVVGYHVFFFCTIMLIHGGRAIMLILVKRIRCDDRSSGRGSQNLCDGARGSDEVL